MWWTVFGDPTNMDPFQIRTQSLFQLLALSPSHATGSNRPFALENELRLHCMPQMMVPAGNLFRNNEDNP